MTRYLWAYTASDQEAVDRNERNIRRRVERGFDVKGFLLSPEWFSRNWMTFQKMDWRYKNGDPMLMRLYEQLGEALNDTDVLIHANGANIHPDFLDQWTGGMKVYTCSDDPESSDILSKPVAAHYDLCLVANAAEVETYRSWGARAEFWAQGSQVTEDDVAHITDESILERRYQPRIVFFGGFGGVGDARAERLTRLVDAFPDAFCAGAGWVMGFIPTGVMHAQYNRAQIGWNVHNSTGPINFRLYDLPAFGVCQIADCKQWMNPVFEVGKEIAAFDTIEEAIELTQYYLDHPDEQRTMALAGHQRWKRDYTPDRVWDRMVKLIEDAKDQSIEWSDVVSSNLARVGYDRKAQRLYVDFKSSGRYVYSGVPFDTYAALLLAESKGGYLASEIKPKYSFEKVSE